MVSKVQIRSQFDLMNELTSLLIDELRVCEYSKAEYYQLPDINSVDDYLIEMRGCRYAGQIELYALSNILKKNISVFTEHEDKYYTIGMGNIYNKSKKDNIYLYHNLMENDDEDDYHYDLLYPKSRSEIISKKKFSELLSRHKPITRLTSINKIHMTCKEQSS